jgi:FkbM family methyltransferase
MPPFVKSICVARSGVPSSKLLERFAWHAGEGIRDRQKVRTYRTQSGFYLTHDLSDPILRHLYVQGDYEPEVTRLITRLARPGQVWWDIGANVGWFTFLLSRLVGASGRVIAFEPNSMVYDWLRVAKERNRSVNVELKSIGLSDRVGNSELFLPVSTNDVLGGHGRPSLVKHEDIESHGYRTITVNTSTIDELIENGLAPPFGIKIDVEGWESAVFKGAEKMFRNSPPALIVSEVNHFPRCLCSPEDLVKQLMSYGYSPWHVETLKPYVPGTSIDGGIYKDFLFIHNRYANPVGGVAGSSNESLDISGIIETLSA